MYFIDFGTLFFTKRQIVLRATFDIGCGNVCRMLHSKASYQDSRL